MPRYVALLRGVSPMNCKMPELKRSFEAAGFGDVRTLLSSGNVVFNARSTPLAALQKRVEKAMLTGAGYSFATTVRPTAFLRQLLDADPFAEFNLPASAKRVVTFLREPETVGDVELPIALHDARILKRVDGEVFCIYVPNEKGPVFMQLLEKTFSKNITTRTWDTVAKCAMA